MKLLESVQLTSTTDQQQFGKQLAANLPPVVFLQGEMGAGKTTLVQGILDGFQFSGAVSSPTYALIHEYPTPKGLVVHIDAYRTTHPAELYEMGLDEYTDHAALILIEWGEALYADFPEAWILQLDYTEAGRQITRIK